MGWALLECVVRVGGWAPVGGGPLESCLEEFLWAPGVRGVWNDGGIISKGVFEMMVGYCRRGV